MSILRQRGRLRLQLQKSDITDIDFDKTVSCITKANSPLEGIDVVINIIDTVEFILPDCPRVGRQTRLKNTRERVIDGLPFA
jgi:isopropylmalate/homocitrate/citramalate synthase